MKAEQLVSFIVVALSHVFCSVSYFPREVHIIIQVYFLSLFKCQNLFQRLSFCAGWLGGHRAPSPCPNNGATITVRELNALHGWCGNRY